MKRTAQLVVLGWIIGCTGPLDTADKVHDLRMLAMRMEPPEQLLIRRRCQSGCCTWTTS